MGPKENVYAVGSPWLSSFEPFQNLLESCDPLKYNSSAAVEELYSCLPHGCQIEEGIIVERLVKGSPSIIEGKLLVGFDEVIIASIFVNDWDFNPSNIGFVKTGNRLIGAKVDHGETLQQLDASITLAQIRNRMCALGYVNWELNFEEILVALRKIAALENLDAIIDAAVDHVNQYVDIREFYCLLTIENENLSTITNIKQYLKNSFKVRQNYFRYIANSLEMEDAIKNNDLECVKALVNRGVPCDMKLDSYFNWNVPKGFLMPSQSSSGGYSMSIEKLNELCQQEESITPLQYAKTIGANEVADFLEACISEAQLRDVSCEKRNFFLDKSQNT